MHNSYTSGAGGRPHQLVGHEARVTQFQSTLQRTELRRPTHAKILYGSRGVGKTVLLHKLAATAKAKRWIVISCQATQDKPVLPIVTLEKFKKPCNAGRTLPGTALEFVTSAFTSFMMRANLVGGYSFEVDSAKDWADNADIDRDLGERLQRLTNFAPENDIGLLIAIDELQKVEIPSL